MNKNVLALDGGIPIRNKKFPHRVNIGDDEKAAVMSVLEDDLLSGFSGTWSDRFFGGPRVQKLERAWEKHFNVKHAISVNSASTALQCAIAASGVGPGDEVIVSPYSMIISATCPFTTGAIPIFADIDPRTFCISAESIRKVITLRTKAIVVVQIFGNTSDMDEIMELANEYNLIVIEDAAQAPDGLYKGRKTGTIGHMGIFSLNVHKTISAGEGGILVTNDDNFAERLQLVRNHGEVVVGKKGTKNIVNMIGSNFRMCEIEAAISLEQLKKLKHLTNPRIKAATQLSDGLRSIPGITVPHFSPDVQHVWYVYCLKYDAAIVGMSREKFVAALNAEGIPVTAGYVKPIYLEPLFQKKIVFGDKGFPYSCDCYADLSNVNYDQGICPIVEKIETEQIIHTNICRADVTKLDIEDVIQAFEKIIDATN
jgi:dTDP-4-amino-4,6-dideoxygalactose transaminase